MHIPASCLAVATGLFLRAANAQSSLPQVDLGYEIHQAIELNVCSSQQILSVHLFQLTGLGNCTNVQLYQHSLCSASSWEASVRSSCAA